MRRMAVLISALVGCAYHPGSFRTGHGPEAEFVGQRATVGCLDVAVARRLDYLASAVLQYRFGNRCARAVEVDLQAAAVIGRLEDGREVTLAPYDPQLELRPVRLGGRLAGGEAIAYPSPAPIAQICVDAASIVRAQPARWMCFETRRDLDTDEAIAAAPGARIGEVTP